MTEERKVIIRLENVTYKYKVYQDDGAPPTEEKRVQNVSLEIFEGEFLALVGHNGSGKSTLAKLLNGLLLAQSGEVCVDGLNPKVKKELYKIREQVGMVFQNPDNQMIASIVEDDIAFGPDNLGVPREEIVERVEGALESVGMSEYHDKTPTKLSGGQKQILNLASVMVMQPDILLLDEPTSQLDPIAAADFIATLRKLNQELGLTILLAEHRLEDVFPLADRAAVMERGRVILSDTPGQAARALRALPGGHPMLLGLPSPL